MTPPPEVRTGLPPEPGPQRSDRTARRSAGRLPSLAPPALGGVDAIDASSLAFLVSGAVEDARNQEEELERLIMLLNEGRAVPHPMRTESERGLPQVGDECGCITSSSVENVINTKQFMKLHLSAIGTTQTLQPKIIPCLVEFYEKRSRIYLNF